MYLSEDIKKYYNINIDYNTWIDNSKTLIYEKDIIYAIEHGYGFIKNEKNFNLFCKYFNCTGNEPYIYHMYNDLSLFPIQKPIFEKINKFKFFSKAKYDKKNFLNDVEYIFFLFHDYGRPFSNPSYSDIILRNFLNKCNYTALLCCTLTTSVPLQKAISNPSYIRSNLLNVDCLAEHPYQKLDPHILNWMNELNEIQTENELKYWLKKNGACDDVIKYKTFYLHNFIEANLYITDSKDDYYYLDLIKGNILPLQIRLRSIIYKFVNIYLNVDFKYIIDDYLFIGKVSNIKNIPLFIYLLNEINNSSKKNIDFNLFCLNHFKNFLNNIPSDKKFIYIKKNNIWNFKYQDQSIHLYSHFKFYIPLLPHDVMSLDLDNKDIHYILDYNTLINICNKFQNFIYTLHLNNYLKINS